MIVLFGAVLGAALGALVAHRRKGNVADMLQYGAVYCLIFALLGLFITLFVHRFAAV